MSLNISIHSTQYNTNTVITSPVDHQDGQQTEE